MSAKPGRASSSDDHVAWLFDTESQGYDDAHEGPRGHLLRARMSVFLDALGPGPGDLLDAGMGPGRLLEELARRGWAVSGLDISERMVELAAARMPHARGRLVRGSVTELPFGDASFDAVSASGVIEYVDDPELAIRELVRVLRPGGLAVLSNPNLSALDTRWGLRVWNPSVRAVKRALPGLAPRPAPYDKPSLIGVPDFVEMVRAAGAVPVALRHACAIVLPTPFDLAAPKLARRLSIRMEAARGRAARALATQVIVVARKPASGQ